MIESAPLQRIFILPSGSSIITDILFLILLETVLVLQPCTIELKNMMQLVFMFGSIYFDNHIIIFVQASVFIAHKFGKVN